MASSLPSPLAAALGVVPAVLDGVRRLPGRAVQLPVLAISNALATMDLVRREYDDLAERGERLVARLRGAAPKDLDELEDRVEDVVERTPFARAYDKAEDTLEDVAEAARKAPAAFAGATEEAVAEVKPLVGRARRAAGSTTRKAASAVEEAAGTVEDKAEQAAGAVEETGGKAADAVEAAAGTVEDKAEQAAGTVEETAGKAADAVEQTADAAAQAVPDAEQPKGEPTPKATEPDATRVDTAASAAVQETVEQAAAAVSAAPLEHDELPLPDYDHMTLGSLRGRMRSLSVEQLVQVRTYEKAHADRLPIVTMLDNRIAKLTTDPAAAPSGPVSTAPAPEQQAAAAAGGGTSAVSPATGGPTPTAPRAAGDPTNPAPPR